jgi:hypothetical protein
MDILRGMASRRAISAWAAARLGTRDHGHGMTAVGEIKKKAHYQLQACKGERSFSNLWDFAAAAAAAAAVSITSRWFCRGRPNHAGGSLFVCLLLSFPLFCYPLFLALFESIISKTNGGKKDAR